MIFLHFRLLEDPFIQLFTNYLSTFGKTVLTGHLQSEGRKEWVHYHVDLVNTPLTWVIPQLLFHSFSH